MLYVPTQHWSPQPWAGAHRSSSGFTLTELIVTVAIIGIVSGIAVSSFFNRMQSERLKTSTQSMAAWLNSVRQLAVAQSETCAVRVLGSDGRLQLEPYGNQATACTSNTPSFDLNGTSASRSIILCAVNQGPTLSAPTCTASSGNLQLVFTPRGTSTTNALLQTRLDGAAPNRCVQLIAPLGLLRIGRVVSGSCNWNSAN